MGCLNELIYVHNFLSDYTAPSYPVRLRGGSTPNQGRVEIRYNGTWGTACERDGNVSPIATFLLDLIVIYLLFFNCKCNSILKIVAIL